MSRILDILVGTTMVLLSLLFQLLAGLLLMFPFFAILDAFGWEEGGLLDFRVFLVAVIAIVNAIACFEYFRRTKAAVSLGGDASIIFLFPRGLDKIVFGQERIRRGA